MSTLASSDTGTAHSTRTYPADEAVPEFDELYRQQFRFTWSVLRRVGVPEAAIEDAAQEVWVIVHRRLDALESPRAVRSWLFQIARRVAARHRRGEQRSRRKIDALGLVPTRRNQPHADRDSQLTVETLLDQLDVRKREAFVLSELEGWSAPEIAKSVGTSPNTVYSRIRLAREELRAGWAERCPGDDLDVTLTELRAQTQPPKGAAKRGWLLLTPKLALGSKAAVTGVAAVASWKLTLAGAGLLGLAAVGGSYMGDRRANPATPTSAAAPTQSLRPSSHAVGSPPASLTPEATEPSAILEPDDVEREPEPEPELEPDAAAAPIARTRRSSPPPVASDLEDETGLLSAAQTSLAADHPKRALAQLAEHRKRFARSPLADLRALLEIKALCAADRKPEAEAAAREAAAAMPGSALVPKMRQACGE